MSEAVMERPLKKFPSHWHHWIIEECQECKTRGQMPVKDEYGDDVNLFEKLEKFRADESLECCGKRLIFKYRHASADNPEVSEFYRLQDKGKLEPILREYEVRRVEESVVAWKEVPA